MTHLISPPPIPRLRRRTSAALLLLLLIAASVRAGAARAREVYLSPTGNDANPGTRERPMATLQAVRDALRRLRAANALGGPVTVLLDGGSYDLTTPFELSAVDSGTAAAPVVYRAAPGKTVRLVGARRVKASDFEPVSDVRTIQRIPPAARGKVVELDLKKLGIRHDSAYPDLFTDSGGIVDLFFGGRRMSLARYPNDSYMTMERVLNNGAPGKAASVFQFRKEDESHFRAWQKELDRGVWLKGYWRVMWQNEAVRVKSIDPDSRRVTFAAAVPGGIGNKYHRPEGNGKEEYWLLNLLDELEQPGSYCVDFEDQKLYFYPPSPLESGEILLADSDSPIVRLTDASHILLRGLTFEGSLREGVVIKGGSDNVVAGCVVHNVDKYGIVVDGGVNHVVQSCDLFDLGAGGVWLGGGDEKKLPRVPAGHRVVNNHIHHFSQIERIYTPGVNCGFTGGGGGGHHPAVGMLVAHNLIHDTPHGGVLFGSWDSVFEYNEVFRYCTFSDDLGAFYCYDSFALDGNQTFRYNLMHGTDDGDGIYFDNDHRDMHIYGNIACLKSLPNRRGTGFLYKIGTQAKNPQSIECYNNIAIRCNVGFQFVSALTELGKTENNVAVSCKTPFIWKAVREGKQVSATPDSSRGKNVVYDSDPGFADMDHLDFGLRPQNQILCDLPNFKPIPVDKIGLYVDEYRTILPTDDQIDRFDKRTKRSPQGYEIEDRQ